MTTVPNPYPVDSTTRACCGAIGAHAPDEPTTPAVTALHTCRDRLLHAALDAADAAPALTGARAARARELLALLDTAITHCDRLANVVEGDARAEVTR
jgi:hypothetical protein